MFSTQNEHEQPAGTSSEAETTAQEVEGRKGKRTKKFTGSDENVSCKSGTVSQDDVLLIAHELGPSWKKFGRVLKVPDAVIDQIDADGSKVSEKCYSVIRRWKERDPFDATYHHLALALQHPTVDRVDVAVKCCGLQSGLSSCLPPKRKRGIENNETEQPAACTSFPSHVIEWIRQVYQKREGVILPVPWCGEFSFQIEDIFTRLRIVEKEKTRGIVTSKEVTSMTSIFSPHEGGEQPLIVLIEGEPGMGKTTYCRKLVFDWASKQCHVLDESFPRIDVLLFLRCREIKSTLWDAIEDQILPEEIEPEEKKMFFQFLKENPSKVLIVLDGLDEADPQKLEMYLKLIQREQLPGCYIVLTSRHEAGRKVRPYTDTLLEIVGFTRTDAECYITKYFQHRDHLAKKLISKLIDDKDLRELTQNPLNTLLLCVIFEDLKGVLPSNRTQLYVEIVLFILRRYESKNGVSNRDENLLLVYKKELMILGRTALASLYNFELHFDDHKGDIKESLLKFGFLSIPSGGSKRAPCNRYGFFHQSFQEFFSGYFLAFSIIDDVTKFRSVLTDRRYLGHLFQAFKFMSGIIAEQSEETAVSVVKSISSISNERGLTSDELVYYLKVAHYFINEYKTCLEDPDTNLARTFGMNLELVDVVLPSLMHPGNINYKGTFLKALTYNSTVTNLKLCEDTLSTEVINSLTEVLRVNTYLLSLDLSNNSIDHYGANSLAQALRVNTSLSSLDMSCNECFGTEGARLLAQALRVNTSLSSLNLRYNSIGDEGTNSLGTALKVNTSLSSLNLRGNSIGDEGANSLAEALRVNPSLSSLNLRYNSIGDKGANSLAQTVRVNTSLSSLDISFNSVGAEGASSLAEALRVNTSLSSLDLRYNSIGDKGASPLAQTVKENTSLSSLNLSDNSIGDEGANSLAEALKVNTSLSSLNLRGNSIGNEGTNSLAQALRVNTSLSSLDLRYNSVGDKGANSLAEALRVNTSLSSLNLSDNSIGDEGADSLAQALRVNTSLSSLTISFNSVGDEGANSLAEALRVNTSLSSLNLRGNSIGDEGANSLAEAVRLNTSLSLDLLQNSVRGEEANLLAETSLSSLDLLCNFIHVAEVKPLAQAARESSLFYIDSPFMLWAESKSFSFLLLPSPVRGVRINCQKK